MTSESEVEKKWEISRYSIDDKDEWDSCVTNATKKHFMFFRNYMDYHSDRFLDASFICRRKGKTVAAIPGTILKDGVWASHAGLTFGGLLSDGSFGISETLALFNLLNEELKKLGACRVRYKPVPWIYSLKPSEEDLYVLFRLNAKLVARQISSALVPGMQKMEERRIRGARKAANCGVQIVESKDFNAFWTMLAECLASRHLVSPVHSADELKLLAGRFPQNIRLFVSMMMDKMVAGTLLFITDKVVHTQYLATSLDGRKCGALDLLISRLLREPWMANKFVDFGVSCEQGGLILNEGLVAQKEGFGGRGVAYDVYEYNL